MTNDAMKERAPALLFARELRSCSVLARLTGVRARFYGKRPLRPPKENYDIEKK